MKDILTEKLKQVLANTYIVFLKTHNYHWNFYGANFYSIHLMLENQYNELFKSIDKIAERITTIGGKAPGDFKSYQKMQIVKDANENLAPQEMLDDLIKSNDQMVVILKECIKITRENDDIATEDLITDEMSNFQKNNWILRSVVRIK